MEIVQQNETRRASKKFGQKVDVEQNGNNYFVYQQHSRLTHETNQSSHSSKSSGGLRRQDTLTPTNKKIGKIVNYEQKEKIIFRADSFANNYTSLLSSSGPTFVVCVRSFGVCVSFICFNWCRPCLLFDFSTVLRWMVDISRHDHHRATMNPIRIRLLLCGRTMSHSQREILFLAKQTKEKSARKRFHAQNSMPAVGASLTERELTQKKRRRRRNEEVMRDVVQPWHTKHMHVRCTYRYVLQIQRF